MSEIIVRIQLDLSDAVKEFMASIMGGFSKPSTSEPVKVVEPASTQPATAPAPPEPTPEPTPAPAAVAPVSELSREKIRNLVKRALIAEKLAPTGKGGGVKAILNKFGASCVPELKEEDFVEFSAELTRYVDGLPQS